MSQSLKDRLKFTEGLTQNLGVQASWVYIFQRNEKIASRNKMTDKQISLWMANEFPEHDSKFFKDLRKGDTNRVQQARTRYNRGDLTLHVVPEIQSHRYNDKGKCSDPIYSGKKGVSLKQPKVKTR